MRDFSSKKCLAKGISLKSSFVGVSIYVNLFFCLPVIAKSCVGDEVVFTLVCFYIRMKNKKLDLVVCKTYTVFNVAYIHALDVICRLSYSLHHEFL